MTLTYTGFGTRSQATPQTEPISGKTMVANSAGGYSFPVDDMTRLRRFLILGTTGGTYYIGERKLTRENLDALERLLSVGRGKEAVDLILAVSKESLASSNDPALFALARCCAADAHGKLTIQPAQRTYTLHRANHPTLFEKFPEEGVPQSRRGGRETLVRYGDTITRTVAAAPLPILVDHPADIEVRRYAYEILPQVARTGTHWLHFQEYVRQFRGRGALDRRARAAWYNAKQAERVAYQVLKYQSRDKWSQRDVLRLGHPKPTTAGHNAVYHWATKGWDATPDIVPSEEAMAQIWAHEKAKLVTDPHALCALIREYRLPREAVPNTMLSHKVVWEALLPHMGLEALTRNLATMTRHGVITPMGEKTYEIVQRLKDKEALQASRLHPIKLLAALLTYKGGRSIRGDATWSPVREIVDALDGAFYLAFKNVEPTGTRQVLALDVSGSMSSGTVGGVPGLTPRVASAALAMVTAATEQYYAIMGFSTTFMELAISPKQRLDDVCAYTSSLPFSGTDCALPMLWAMQHKIEADAFVVYTDSETWSGRIHPVQALQQYRQKIGRAARLVVVGMTSSGFTIADPDDAGMLDVVGMSTDTPATIADFVAGRM